MKVIMTGGGTGGHIYPAIAIADKIKRKNPDAEILFVGTARGHEKELIPKAGYPIRFITVSGFDRKRPFTVLKTLRDYRAGEKQAKAIIKEFQPDVVIGTGGYVCGPVVRAAHRQGIRSFIHEQNAYPGLTNRILERYVEKVFLAYPEAEGYFKQKKKLVVTGNPLRRDFLLAGLSDDREKLGIRPAEFCLLCFGGSLGAGALNAVISEIATGLAAIPNSKLILITGRRNYEETLALFAEKGLADAEQIRILPYADNMPEYLRAADLVISRSGALTVSEITACGKPAILIPSPNVTGNHQYFNAKAVSDRGGAILIEEKDLHAEHLLGVILRLFGNRGALNAMAENSRSIGRTDGADAIYDELKLK